MEEAGREKHIFDLNGTHIPQQEVIIKEDMIHNGMLFNLCTLHHLFQRTKIDIAQQDHDEPMTPHYLYPMACLKTIGHFQANRLMTPFATQLHRLDRRLKQMYDEDEEDGIEADLLAGYMPVVEEIACQGYNMLSHRVCSQG